MAWALADSLLQCGGFNPRHAMDCFLDWLENGKYSSTGIAFGIGRTTSRSLKRYKASMAPFSGSIDPSTAGNGSVMRLAPIVLWSIRNKDEARRLAREQSKLTHAAIDAVDASELLAIWIHGGISEGKPPADISVWAGESIAIGDIARGEYRSKKRDDIQSTSYCAHTVEAAAWAIHNSQSFEEALVLAVNLGGDADTVGSVTGQVAGAVYGYSSIPSRWLKPLTSRAQIVAIARALIAQGD
jgi:ADP-ribosyl-[dinitrogen reductase] hydrolase